MSNTNLTEASQRIEQLLVQALGARHPAIDDWAQIRFALRTADRYSHLRDAGCSLSAGEDVLTGEALDRRIDSEMAQGREAAPAAAGEEQGRLAPHFKAEAEVEGALAGEGEEEEEGLQVSCGLKWCDQCGEGTVQGLCRKRLADCKFAVGESYSASEAHAQLVESFLSASKLQLAAGEMSAQELRSVKAVLKMLAAQIRRGDAVDQREDQYKQLLEAGKAVVARWDSPNWKHVGHTGEFISSLRAAIAAIDAGWKGLGVLSSANPKPIWVVMDDEGYPKGSSSWPELCHRYLDAAARNGEDVHNWMVRRFLPGLPVRGPNYSEAKEVAPW